jgi:very-short-patch-repair endonuclease
MDEQRLHRLAAGKLGLFTRSDATRCGFTPYQIRRRLAIGEWQRVRGPVFAFRGRPLIPRVLIAAAHLSTPGSVIAGPSAALWYDLPVTRPGIWLWTGPNGRGSVEGVRLLRDRLADEDVRRGDGVLVTSPGRTVFDCLRVMPEDGALTVLDRALQQGWAWSGELAQRMRDHAGGRSVSRAARLLLMAAGTRSTAERLAVKLLRDAGIGGWVANAEIRDRAGLVGYGDIVFRTARVVVEIDGWTYHGDRERFQRDRTRQNRLVSAGWTVLRFTWDDLTRRPQQMLAAVRAALAS